MSEKKSKIRLQLEENAENALFELWRMYPLMWLENRLGENPKDYKWSNHSGYKKHEWDGSQDPLASAWEDLANNYTRVCNGQLPEKRVIALESATGTGKTYWASRVIFWFLDCFKNSLVVTSAPSKEQLNIGLWSELQRLFPKIKRLRPESCKYKSRLYMEHTPLQNMDEFQELEQLSASWHATMHIAGTKADEVSADKARGFHRENMLIILEECTGIPQSVITAFQNTCTGGLNFIVALGNPNSEFDSLHQLALQQDCKNYRISAFDHPNIVLNDEIYAGAVTNVSINSRSVNYNEDSPFWNAMVRGICPVQSLDSLIRKEWVDECIDTYHPDVDGCDNAVGVDVANSVDGDKAATAWGRSNSLVEVNEFKCNNATHLAYNIIYDTGNLALRGYENYGLPTCHDYGVKSANIGIDAVGIGVATVNAFLDKGFKDVQSLEGGAWKEVIPKEVNRSGNKFKETPLYSFQNLRAQMYWQLREDLRLKKINIRLKDNLMVNQLVKEICTPKVVRGQKITIESKDDVKKRLGGKSPNVADAIVYWNWTRHSYRTLSKGQFTPLYGGYEN